MKKVLIVEDDPFLVKAYQYIFENQSIEVQVAHDGQEALKLFEGPPVGVVLLDIMLPGMSGLDVLQAMSKSSDWDGVPVIILTNLDRPEEQARAKELGAAEYLVKSTVDIEGVLAMVRKYLSMEGSA